MIFNKFTILALLAASAAAQDRSLRVVSDQLLMIHGSLDLLLKWQCALPLAHH